MALIALPATLGGCQLLFPTSNFERGHDAGQSDGASADASVDSRPPSNWCAARDAGYRLCSDFDQSDAVTQGFDLGAETVPGSVGGSFALDSTDFVSPSNSALGKANPFAPGQTTGIRLIGTLWPLGPIPAAVDCTLMWKPVGLSTTAQDYAHVVQIVFYTDAQQKSEVASLSINMQGDGAIILLEDYGVQSPDNAVHPIGSNITPNTWYPVSLSFASSASGASYQVKVGDKRSAGTLARVLPSNSYGTLEVGPAYFAGATTSPSPGWSFAYDNVVCY